MIGLLLVLTEAKVTDAPIIAAPPGLFKAVAHRAVMSLSLRERRSRAWRGVPANTPDTAPASSFLLPAARFPRSTTMTRFVAGKRISRRPHPLALAPPGS